MEGAARIIMSRVIAARERDGVLIIMVATPSQNRVSLAPVALAIGANYTRAILRKRVARHIFAAFAAFPTLLLN
jgi:hypothetical protein